MESVNFCLIFGEILQLIDSDLRFFVRQQLWERCVLHAVYFIRYAGIAHHQALRAP